MTGKKENGWKQREGVVFSTDPNFNYNQGAGQEEDTLPPAQQTLRVQIDRKQRGGKSVTLVTGFVGREMDLQALGKLLKTKCGVGGSAKDGEIVVQGELREKVAELLAKEGYKVKKVGAKASFFSIQGTDIVGWI
ncbi:MAG: translation initiation factor [Cytophagales bacterium]|nr:translation initiation factor [Cytophagales bacterium]